MEGNECLRRGREDVKKIVGEGSDKWEDRGWGNVIEVEVREVEDHHISFVGLPGTGEILVAWQDSQSVV